MRRPLDVKVGTGVGCHLGCRARRRKLDVAGSSTRAVQNFERHARGFAIAPCFRGGKRDASLIRQLIRASARLQLVLRISAPRIKFTHILERHARGFAGAPCIRSSKGDGSLIRQLVATVAPYIRRLCVIWSRVACNARFRELEIAIRYARRASSWRITGCHIAFHVEGGASLCRCPWLFDEKGISCVCCHMGCRARCRKFDIAG